MEKPASAVTTQSSTSMSVSDTSVPKLQDPNREVRVLRLREYKQAAQCLAEAFTDDEVARYPIDTPDRQHWTAKQKWTLHVSIMECLVKAHIMRGVVTAIGPSYDCVAMWYAERLTSSSAYALYIAKCDTGCHPVRTLMTSVASSGADC